MTSRFRSAFQLAIAIVLFVMVAILSRQFYRWLESAEANSADSSPSAVVPVNFDAGAECERMLDRIGRQARTSEMEIARFETARRADCLHS